MVCRDGVALATRLWRPLGDGPWPVLLMRQPYGRAIASTVTYAHPSWYAAHGYLVVVQDVRGRGDSGGQFRGFVQEAADGADAVRWARRLQGSNGRLGTYGFSYQGLSQLLNDGGGLDEERGDQVAKGPFDPEALPDCLAPAMCGLDERRHWAGSGGCHWWVLGLTWGLQLAAEGCRRRGERRAWQEIRQCLAAGQAADAGLALLRRHDPASMVLAWLEADPAAAEPWRIHEPSAALLGRPMLLIGGWWDPHLEGLLDLWSRSRAAGGAPQLRIGPWSHLNWRGGIDRLQLAFFRHHLQRDRASSSEPGNPGRPAATTIHVIDTAQFETDSLETEQHDSEQHDSPAIDPASITPGSWLEVEPAEALGGPWWLASTGLAAVDSHEGRLLPAGSIPVAGRHDRAAASVTLVHDPWRPVPGRGGHLGLDAGPVDRGDLDQRADVACFTTVPLQEPLVLQGRPVLTLAVTADQPSFDLCGALALVTAAGGVQQLCTGVLRLPAAPRQRNRSCRLVFQPLRHTLAAGQQLRLSLAGAAWPQVAVNPGSGVLPRSGAGLEHRIITLTLHLPGSLLQLEPLVSARLS